MTHPPRKKRWITATSWSGFFFVVFLWLIYWCISPPQTTVSVHTRYGTVATTLGDKYPYWSIITSTVIAGLIWLITLSAWIDKRDRQHATELEKYRQTHPASDKDAGVRKEAPRAQPVPAPAGAEAERHLQELSNDPEIHRRAGQFRELAELAAISVVRAGMEEAVMQAAGVGPRGPSGLMQGLRASFATFILSETHQARPLVPADGVFLWLTTGDFTPAAAEPGTAWKFLQYMAGRPGFTGDVTLAEWTKLFEECRPYNRAAGDHTTSPALEQTFTELLAEFRMPWPSQTTQTPT